MIDEALVATIRKAQVEALAKFGRAVLAGDEAAAARARADAHDAIDAIDAAYDIAAARFREHRTRLQRFGL